MSTLALLRKQGIATMQMESLQQTSTCSRISTSWMDLAAHASDTILQRVAAPNCR